MKTLIVSPDGRGKRLDAWLSEQEPDLSRSRIQSLIRAGSILLNGCPTKPSQKLVREMAISVDVPPPVSSELVPEDIPLDVLFEDADIVVLNKPAGLVVHPAAGHASGTLVNALLAHCPDLAGIGGEKRPGIVHRLDRDTTGVMVVAKNEFAMHGLVSQFRQRQVEKEYLALVWGRLAPTSGRVETPIGRNPRNRKTMSATSGSGRLAITTYQTIELFRDTSLVTVRIETGRTHQIRVHMAFLGHSVLGDPQYGRQRHQVLPIPVPARQMLHAIRLGLNHPRTDERLIIEAPVPDDMRVLLETLRNQSK